MERLVRLVVEPAADTSAALPHVLRGILVAGMVAPQTLLTCTVCGHDSAETALVTNLDGVIACPSCGTPGAMWSLRQ